MPVLLPKATHSLYLDACQEGWGVSHNTGLSQVSTGGRWSAEELSLSHHINFLELLAIFHGLKSFLNFSDLHVTVFSDNTTATAYINHMGGTHSSLLSFLARCIWLWCKERAIWLSAFHIPVGKMAQGTLSQGTLMITLSGL